jgi:YVTN family beta-propeller protein
MFSSLAQAETLTASLPMDGPGQAIAVNPATNKIYLTNAPEGVLVVDGATNVTTKVGGSTSPTALALNPLSNKIYAVNSGSNNVTVIDGGNNSTVTVVVGTNPIAVAVNPVTNKIYVADNADVTVIDGTNNSKTNISSILLPSCIAVNPVTNKIYVPGNTGFSYGVTVINGADNTTSFVATGLNPDAIAVNPVTNKIYVANQASGTVTVINGADNTTATVSAGTNPIAVGLNPVTNKIYVANQGDGTHASAVTVIDGGNNTTTTVNAGISPEAVAVDSVTNRIYVTNLDDSNLTVIDGTTNTAKNLSIGSTGNTVEFAVATNPITNKIYVGTGVISGFSITSSVAVVDGATNTTATLAAVAPQRAVAVNPASNRIYAVSPTGNAVTVINGVTDTVMDTVITGTNPQALAINPATNKIYVANHDSNSLTVINGANDTTTTVAVNASPSALAVDPVTNRIYVVYDNNSIMDVFDGATDTPTAYAILPSGSVAVAVNPVSNKVYALSASGNSVTVIDGASTTTTTIVAGTTPLAIAVNPVTNKIYVANYASNNVTVINGADNTTTTVAVGSGPIAVAVNPVSNRVYVSDVLSNDVAVIDGLTNAVTPVTVGTHPADVQVDPVTNRIYVANRGSNNVTFIDGPTNVANNINTASTPFALGINPATGKIYTTMSSNNILSVITEQKVQPSLLATTIAPLPENQFIFPGSPTFNFAIDTAVLPVQGVYFQPDTWQGLWAKASGSGDNFSGTAPALLPGIHIVYAYAVDSQFADSIQPGNSNGGQSSPIPGAMVAYVFVVRPAPTTTILSLAGGQNPAVYGQILTFSATVSDGAGTPTGVADYTLFGVFGGAFLLGMQTLDGNGQAQLSYATLAPGDYQITASYEGNSVYGSSTSSRLNLTVNRAASSTAVTGTTSAIYGQPVTLIASVLPQFTGTPIGKVHFYDGATLMGTATLSSGSATLITSTLSGGAHSITAVYDGDTNFMDSDSSASLLTVTVSRATSTAGISLLLGSNPSTYGVPLFFQAVVTPQFSGTPGGQVTFKDGNTVIGTHALINGQAIITVATLVIGAHSITAIYSGDGNFTGSTSSALSQTVNAGSGTATTVTLSFFPTVQPNTRLFGRAVAYIATVSPSTATGSIYFIDGNTLVGSGALSNSGSAVFIANQFTVGRHSITAAYGGDGTYSSNVSVPGVFYRSPRPH